MPKLSADDRLQRLLAVVPWVAARDGPRLDDVCTRFDCREDELVDDLQMLFLCGLHPYTPDMLIDVDIADGRVWIRYADYFARPLKLTPAEGLALLAAGRTLLATPGADPAAPWTAAWPSWPPLSASTPTRRWRSPSEPWPSGSWRSCGRRWPAPAGRDRVLLLRPGRVDPPDRRPVLGFSAAGQWYLSG